jgi:chromosome segregation ATPase
VLTALKQEVRRLAAELAAARDENAGLRGELQAAHDKFAQHKLKTDDLVTKLRGASCVDSMYCVYVCV